MAHLNSRPSVLRWREIPAGVWALGVVSLLMDVSSEMIHALLPLYLATALGASMLTIGAIEGFAEATAMIVRIVSGVLSDRLGRRKVLAAIGYGLAAFTKPVFPLAPSIAWLVAARLIDRVGKGIRGAPRDALIADLAPEALRGASFGLRQSLDTVGALLAPLFVVVLMALTADDFILVFWIAVPPAFLAFAVILFAVRDPDRREVRVVRAPLSRMELSRLDRSYWVIVTIAAIFALARFSEAFLLLRARSVGVPLAFAPAVMVVMNGVFALSAWPAGVLSDRIGRRGLLIAGLAVLIIADLVLGLGSNFAWIGLGVALWGLHMGLTQGLFAALVADLCPAELRGTAFGMFNLVTGSATLTASVVAGALWDRAGPSATFLAGAVFAATALIAMLLARRLRVA
ncbi:MAG: MFS transporter [Rhodoplanes sp.]